MKRSFLIWIIAAMTAICLPAMAAEENIDLSAQSGTVMITEAGSYTLSGKLEGTVIVDAPDDADVELILAGVEITASDGAAIYCRQAKDLDITLADDTENVLTDSAFYVFDDPEKEEPDAALFSRCDLKIRGNGALTVNGNYKHGIASKDDLKIKDGKITVKSVSDALRGKDSVTVEDGVIVLRAGKDGISATNDTRSDKGWVEIYDGKIDIEAAGDAVQAETTLTVSGGDFVITTEGRSSGSSQSQKGLKANGDIVIGGGTFWLKTADDGIHSESNLTINGGDFQIESGDDAVHADLDLTVNGGTFQIPYCHEGFEGTVITFNGGNVFIDAQDDAIGGAAGTDELRMRNDRNGNPAVAVTINGGEIEAVSGGDTVDSNGDIRVTGGKLRLNSPADPYYEGALLCNGRVTVTGGDIAFVGNIGVELTVENQPMLLVSFPRSQASGSVVSLRNADGEEILTHTSRRNYSQAVFSCDQMHIGETYGMYVDGELIVEVTMEDYITKAASDGGSFTGGYPRGHW